MTPPTDITDLNSEELPSNICWDLLRASSVGRLAFCLADGTPDVLPLNYVVAHGAVVFRTSFGGKLEALRGFPHVAFEVDGDDLKSGVAWSVVLKGVAEDIQGMTELLDTASLRVFPWQGGSKNFFVKITPGVLTGRRFRITEPETWLNPLSQASHASDE